MEDAVEASRVGLRWIARVQSLRRTQKRQLPNKFRCQNRSQSGKYPSQANLAHETLGSLSGRAQLLVDTQPARRQSRDWLRQHIRRSSIPQAWNADRLPRATD